MIGFVVGMVVGVAVSVVYVRFKMEPYWMKQIQELQKKLYQAKQGNADGGRDSHR